MSASDSWLLQGLSQPDSRRDWRPRPRSVTPGGPLDGGISWEPGMPARLGKSILLLPTAASSDSSVQDPVQRCRKRDGRGSVKTANNCCFSLRYSEQGMKSFVTQTRLREEIKQLPSSPHLPLPWLTGELTCCLCAR